MTTRLARRNRFKTKCQREIYNIDYTDTLTLKRIYEAIIAIRKGDILIEEEPIMKPIDKIIYEDEISLYLDKGTGNTCAMFGSSKSGKSTLISHIYDKYYNHDEIISTLFTDSPQNKILNGKEDLALCNNFGKAACKLINAQKYFNQKTNNRYEYLDILDDIIDISYNKVLNKMILIYRNSNISTIVSLQYCKILSKKARGNVNNVILLSLNSDEAIEQAIKLYLKSYFRKMGVFGMDDMIDFYRELTSNYGMIYIRPSDSRFIKFIRLDISKDTDVIYPDGYFKRLDARLLKAEKDSVEDIDIEGLLGQSDEDVIDRKYILKNKPELYIVREYFDKQLESINLDSELFIFD